MKKLLLFSILLLASAISYPDLSGALDTPAAGTTYSYPLPAQAGGIVKIVYSMKESGSVQILAYNEASDLVVDFNDTKPVGLQTSQIDLCCLAPGVYLYLVLMNYDS